MNTEQERLLALYRAAFVAAPAQGRALLRGVDESRWAQADELNASLGHPLSPTQWRAALHSWPIYWTHAPDLLLQRFHPTDWFKVLFRWGMDFCAPMLTRLDAKLPDEVHHRRGFAALESWLAGERSLTSLAPALTEAHEQMNLLNNANELGRLSVNVWGESYVLRNLFLAAVRPPAGDRVAEAVRFATQEARLPPSLPRERLIDVALGLPLAPLPQRP